MRTLMYRGQWAAGQGGSAHSWMGTGEQSTCPLPSMRQTEAPVCAQSGSRSCAATAESCPSPQRGTVSVTQHLLQQHSSFSCCSTPGRCPQHPTRSCGLSSAGCLSLLSVHLPQQHWALRCSHQACHQSPNSRQRPAAATTRSSHHQDRYAHPSANPARTASSRR